MHIIYILYRVRHNILFSFRSELTTKKGRWDGMTGHQILGIVINSTVQRDIFIDSRPSYHQRPDDVVTYHISLTASSLLRTRSWQRTPAWSIPGFFALFCPFSLALYIKLYTVTSHFQIERFAIPLPFPGPRFLAYNSLHSDHS